MKKTISVLMVFVLAFTFMAGCSAAEQTNENVEKFVLTMQIGNPIMTVNGKETSIDEEGTAPVVDNERTLVPVRAIVEAMGGKVEWLNETSTAVLTLGKDTVKLTVGSTSAYFNDREDTLDVVPKIINDRTMLPIRYIAECFKFEVEWDNDTQTVTITKELAVKSDMNTSDTQTGSNILVAFYSESGNTERVASYIKDATNADIFRLEPVNEYSDADLNYSNDNSRVNKEHKDENLRDTELKNTTPENWDEYDIVFIGYPIWWGIAAWPVNNFVKDNDFSGKTVIPFCTSASSPLGESGKLLKEMASAGDWQEGKRFRSSAAESDVTEWIDTLNLTQYSGNRE